MTLAPEVRAQVRAFYDSIGWQQVGEGVYQNARYEDLRPVSREYIHRCHLRVGRHLPLRGRLLLDAGSGPIQYPEYLTYSQGYDRRVCLDLSRRALIEARQRIGGHGRFVVGDVARLPFAESVFDGVVALHTLHHLPPREQSGAVRGMLRTLVPGGRGVVVHSWGEHSPLMRLMRLPIAAAFAGQRLIRQLRSGAPEPVGEPSPQPTGTYTRPAGPGQLRRELAGVPGFDLRVWRTVSTSFMRAFVYRRLGGALALRLVYAAEERFPRRLASLGQYAMILFARPAPGGTADERAT